ncbi:hypothetical protein JL722_2469 [Aureococcus anophagefferens]|nr:hypothetical protein JL722_2469 [Aureococcus anophagefferens]
MRRGRRYPVLRLGKVPLAAPSARQPLSESCPPVGSPFEPSSMMLYQGGASCELLGASGKDPLKRWKAKASGGVKRLYDSGTRGYVYSIDGGAATRLALGDGAPRSSRGAHSLGLLHRYLVLQLELPPSDARPFAVELVVSDEKRNRRRVLLSSAFAAASRTPLHAQLPLGGAFEGKRGKWLHWRVDVAGLAKSRSAKRSRYTRSTASPWAPRDDDDADARPPTRKTPRAPTPAPPAQEEDEAAFEEDDAFDDAPEDEDDEAFDDAPEDDEAFDDAPLGEDEDDGAPLSPLRVSTVGGADDDEPRHADYAAGDYGDEEAPPAYDGDVDLTVASPHDGGAPPAYCSFADQSASVLLASVAASRPSAKAPATDASYFFDGLPVRPPTSTLTPAAAAPRGAAASRSVRFSRNPVDVSAGVSVSRQSVPGISMQSAEWVERTRGGADVMVRASAASVESLALANALAALDDDDEPPPTPFRDSYEPLRDSFAANVAPKRAGTPFAKPLGTPFRDSDAGPATPFARGATPFHDSFADDTPAASIDAPPVAAPGVDPSFLAQVQAMARAHAPGVEARDRRAAPRSVESVRESGATLGRPETAKSFLVRESGASLCRPDTAESVRVRESAASLCRPATARSLRESVEPARESAPSLRMSSVEPARESATSLRMSSRPATAAKSVRQSVEPARQSATSLRSARPATAAKSVRQSVEPARESTASLSRPATAKSVRQIAEPARESAASVRMSSRPATAAKSLRESVEPARESAASLRPATAKSLQIVEPARQSTASSA